jgi:hypothetical protein
VQLWTPSQRCLNLTGALLRCMLYFAAMQLTPQAHHHRCCVLCPVLCTQPAPHKPHRGRGSANPGWGLSDEMVQTLAFNAEGSKASPLQRPDKLVWTVAQVPRNPIADLLRHRMSDPAIEASAAKVRLSSCACPLSAGEGRQPAAAHPVCNDAAHDMLEHAACPCVSDATLLKAIVADVNVPLHVLCCSACAVFSLRCSAL